MVFLSFRNGTQCTFVKNFEKICSLTIPTTRSIFLETLIPSGKPLSLFTLFHHGQSFLISPLCLFSILILVYHVPPALRFRAPLNRGHLRITVWHNFSHCLVTWAPGSPHFKPFPNFPDFVWPMNDLILLYRFSLLAFLPLTVRRESTPSVNTTRFFLILLARF